MLYFKYNTSFKKVGTLQNLLDKQGIARIDDQENFLKRFSKGDNIYAFVSPYHSEIDAEIVLQWGNTEAEAWDKFYASQEEI
jgi:hypothetical protein